MKNCIVITSGILGLSLLANCNNAQMERQAGTAQCRALAEDLQYLVGMGFQEAVEELDKKPQIAKMVEYEYKNSMPGSYLMEDTVFVLHSEPLIIGGSEMGGGEILGVSCREAYGEEPPAIPDPKFVLEER